MTYYTLSNPQIIGEGYGITVIDVRVVRDISSDYGVVKRLIDECNSNGVAAVHFNDVMENYLSDFKTF